MGHYTRMEIYKEIEKQWRQQKYLSVDKKCAYCAHYITGACKAQLDYNERDCPKWHTSRKRREYGSKKDTKTEHE